MHLFHHRKSWCIAAQPNNGMHPTADTTVVIYINR
jgi:hypothetical protein